MTHHEASQHFKSITEENKRLRGVIDNAIQLCLDCGLVDGSRHKMYVIDQVLRILAGDKYDDLLKNIDFFWETGTPC